MKTLEVNSLLQGLENTFNDIESKQEQVTTVQQAITGFTSLENDLKGSAGTSLRSFYNDCHQPFLKYIQQSMTDYKDIINSMKEAVNSFESSDDGYVSQAYLESDVKEGFEKVETQATEMTNDANSIISKVQDLVSIQNIDESEVIDAITRGETKSTEIVEELHALDESQKSALQPIKEDLQVMKNFLSSIESKFSSGAISVSDFKVSSLNSIDSYKVIKEGITSKGVEDTIEQAEAELNETLPDLDEDSQNFLIQAYEDFKNGEIDADTFSSIRSGLLQTGSAYVQNLINAKVTDELVDSAVTAAVRWAQNNTENFVNRGLVAAPVYGNVVTISEPPNTVKQLARSTARNGVPILGAAVDFGLQVYNGEDVGDAAIKTAGHLAAGATGAAIGTAIPIPIVGTAIGFAVGVGLSMAVDYIYDNRDAVVEIAKDVGKKAVESVGNAVSGFFSGLGSVFG